MTKKGQTNIPAVIRKRHHIQEGDRLVWLDDGEVMRVVPVSADSLKALRGVGKGEGLLNRLLQDRREDRERDTVRGKQVAGMAVAPEVLDKGPRRVTDFCHANDATAG